MKAIIPHDYSQDLAAANTFYENGDLEKAGEKFLFLIENKEYFEYAYLRLAQIANQTGQPEVAYETFYKLLELKPEAMRVLTQPDGAGHNYVFKGLKDELTIEKCPLCGKPGAPYWCYFMPAMNIGYNAQFNPVRMWMHCEDCNHLYARSFPKTLEPSGGAPIQTNPRLFSGYSQTFSSIRQYTGGSKLLDIGVGGCEASLVAREMGYEVLAVDIVERCVDTARNKYGLNAILQDILTYETDQKFDVIVMGDVLEHVMDPPLLLKKVARLLEDDGVLWISTPNFQGAFAAFAGHGDPMRAEAFHTNYFSSESLYKSLDQHGLAPIDYRVSSHYNGSMEITVVKAARLQAAE